VREVYVGDHTNTDHSFVQAHEPIFEKHKITKGRDKKEKEKESQNKTNFTLIAVVIERARVPYDDGFVRSGSITGH